MKYNTADDYPNEARVVYSGNLNRNGSVVGKLNRQNPLLDNRIVAVEWDDGELQAVPVCHLITTFAVRSIK